MISYFNSSIIFNEIEYFIFINLLLFSLFVFYMFLFFIIFNSSLLLSSIYFNDVFIESFITFISLIYVLLIISPGLLLFLDLDLITSSSFLVYILGYQWAWSYTLYLPFSGSNLNFINFDQLLLSSSLFSLSSFNSIVQILLSNLLYSLFISYGWCCNFISSLLNYISFSSIFYGFNWFYTSFNLSLFLLSSLSSFGFLGFSSLFSHLFYFSYAWFKNDLFNCFSFSTFYLNFNSLFNFGFNLMVQIPLFNLFNFSFLLNWCCNFFSSLSNLFYSSFGLFGLPGFGLNNILFSSFYMCLFNNYLILSLFSYIRLYVSSFDVIHSFGYHSFGIKSDAIPGRLNFVSNLLLFNSGSFIGFCYELCGLAHTSMLISCFVF